LSQWDVVDILRKQRLTGNDSFFTVGEIEKLMKDEGFTNGTITNVRRNVLKLENCDILEYKTSGKFSKWKFHYRIKDKYVVRN
jgi:hypothetical protein